MRTVGGWFAFRKFQNKGSVHGGWWGAHRGAGELEPVSVSEVEEVILHDDGDGLHDGLVSFSLREEASDLGDGVVRVDVGVHRDGVGGEETGSFRQSREGCQETSELKGALEVGR